MPYRFAHHTGPDWRTICDQVLADVATETPEGDLAFVYIDHNLTGDADRIIDYLRGHTGYRHWVGSVGMGLCSTGLETYDENAVAVMLTDIMDNEMRIIPPIGDQVDEFLESTADWRARTLASIGVVHGDPGNNRVPGLLEELAEGLQGGFLTGGITSSSSLQVQIADHAVGGGLSGVLFSGDTCVRVGISQGCVPFGHRHKVTECQNNVIFTLDDRPALDVFKEAIGPELARDLQQVGGLIFVALPVPGSDTGDYMVRNLVGIDPEKGLLAIGQVVSEGQEIQFTRRDPASARIDLAHALDTLRERLPNEPKGMLYHSCLGRGRNLFGDDSEELQIIAGHLGKVPLVGFYANGEISHNRLYGYTGVLTVFC